LDFFKFTNLDGARSLGKRLSNEAHGIRHTAFTRDGAFCTNCCFGATTKKLDEKASLYEGHGFSRAVKTYALDGFSR
jgi:hypothetical protein